MPDKFRRTFYPGKIAGSRGFESHRARIFLLRYIQSSFARIIFININICQILMKLRIPFYRQESKNDCGPTALQMVLEYLGEIHLRKDLIDLVDSDKSGAVWTLGLAKAAAELGFKTEFYTTCLGLNPKNYELVYYQKETDGTASSKQKLERLEAEAHSLGVYMEERSLTLKEILSKTSKDCIPIILLDWSKIKGTQNFIGHFVPIVGYDEKKVYVHNQGFHNPGTFIPIDVELFNKARKSKGTDEDIVYIHRKLKS